MIVHASHVGWTSLVSRWPFSVVCQMFAQSLVSICFDTNISPLWPSRSVFLGLGVRHWPGKGGILDSSSPFFLDTEMHSFNSRLIPFELSMKLPSSLASGWAGASPDTVPLLDLSAHLLCFLTPFATLSRVVQASLEFTIESRMTCDLPASSSQI